MVVLSKKQSQYLVFSVDHDALKSCLVIIFGALNYKKNHPGMMIPFDE